MLELGVKTLLAYGLGAILGSLVLGRLRKVDIRTLGSGNAGGTNALRTQGVTFGLAVLVIDIGKGILAVLVLPGLTLPGIAADHTVSREWLQMCCAAAVVLGHVWPIWFDFRGGKGAATVVGVVAALHPWTLIPLLATWLIVLMLTGFVGLSTMLAGVVLVAAVWLRTPEDLPFLTLCIGFAAFIVYTHRSNISRMLNGTENRARRLWLLRPRSP
jgi:glycerol-3-phosphate acyltransferase PlsY